MTRFLSQILGATEPTFSQSIQQLERASGHPSADIRLTAELRLKLRTKLMELGLDPQDTTGPELYEALQQKLQADEIQVRRALGIKPTADADTVVSRVHLYLEHRDMPKQCFALKTSVAKRLLKKKPPKTVMKRLHYRSLDSMLKHEPVAALYAAALAVEPASWHKTFREQYLKLRPSDFETRSMHLIHPTSARWLEIAAQFVAQTHHNIISFKELGSIVMLPVTTHLEGQAITTLLLTLEEMNASRAYSSFAKLQQVKSHFGSIIRDTATAEPTTSASLAGQPVAWRTIHRYYAQDQKAYHPEVFEPHVQPEDLSWLRNETILSGIAPTLRFWHGTESLGLLHNGQPVSCNVLDVALGFCNKLSFEDRIVHFVRDNIWHDLMLKYLHERNVEEVVHQQLAGELAEGTV